MSSICLPLCSVLANCACALKIPALTMQSLTQQTGAINSERMPDMSVKAFWDTLMQRSFTSRLVCTNEPERAPGASTLTYFLFHFFVSVCIHLFFCLPSSTEFVCQAPWFSVADLCVSHWDAIAWSRKLSMPATRGTSYNGIQPATILKETNLTTKMKIQRPMRLPQKATRLQKLL